jgi:cytochrome c556
MTMRIANLAASAGLALLLASGGPQASQANTARPLTKAQAVKVMHDRHEGMEDIGKNNKVLRRELTAAAPDLGAMRAAAAAIARHSSEASAWFPAGTGPEAGNTGAKPEIWQKPQDFTSKLHNFQVAAQAFNAAARGGDVAAIKARYADLGGTCKACHDSYRSEMKH